MSVTQQPISTFTVTVSGRTLTPVGSVAINDLRPRTPTGSLTFAGLVNGAQFDVYALAAANNQYSLLALPSGTSVVGRTDVQPLGTVLDFVSTGTIQWIPLSGASLDTYIKLLADGVHVLPFGNLGYAGVVLETVDGITNNFLLFQNGTDALLGLYWLLQSNGKSLFLRGVNIVNNTAGVFQATSTGDLTMNSSGGRAQLVGSVNAPTSQRGRFHSKGGGAVIEASSASILYSPAAGEIALLNDFGSAINILASGALTMQSLTATAALTGQTQLTLESVAGAIFLVTVAAGQSVIIDADTTIFNNHTGVTQFGFVNSAQMHHSTLLSAPTKSFLIPHPTRPGYVLEHNAVEMPEPCVKYRGTVTLDATGKATLALPPYANALIDVTKITVQLTAIGATPFACSYQYAGQIIHGAPNGAVAWEATGTRLDVQPTAVVYPSPPDYDESAFPYPDRINAMRDSVGAAHLSTTPLTRVASLGVEKKGAD